MKHSESLKQALLSPPQNLYRPWPLFVLNEDYDDEAGLKRLLDCLEALKQAGFGGIYIHPRPGLLTEYLSPRWFEVVERLVEKCVELDLVPALYDENSYPSGGAGGHTCARRPETRSRSIAVESGTGPDVPAGSFAVYAYSDTDGIGERMAMPQADASWVAFYWLESSVLDWHGQVAEPSLLDPLTTQTFLEATHEQYIKHLSKKAQGAIASMFTDEPHLVSNAHGPFGTSLHLTPAVATRFRLELGYDILEHLPELFFNTGDYEAVRYDFYNFCHQEWVEHWAKPLQEWHQQQGWPLTGHYLEHDWPVPYATPGQMELLYYMDWPGTDLLGSSALRGRDYFELQNMSPEDAGRDPHLLYYLKQTQSVANQFGKERVMNECWGAGGHASTPADWLRMGRFLITHGVNHLVPHHTMSSLRGTRRYDHPQFFSPQCSWFEYLPQLNYELGQLSELMTLGKMRNRVLFLDPQITGFTLSQKTDCQKRDLLTLFNKAGPIQNQVTHNELRCAANTIAQELAERQVDFDIGDEYLMEDHASVTDAGELQLGEQNYELLVWPAGMTQLRKETAQLLEEYLKAGGRLVGVRPESLKVSGRESDCLRNWEERFAEQCHWVDASEVASEVAKKVPPRIKFNAEGPGLYHQRRELESGAVWLLINVGGDPVELVLPDEGDCVALALREDQAPEKIENRLVLGPQSARVIVQGEMASAVSASAPSATTSAENRSSQPLLVSRVTPAGANVMVLDRCELEMAGRIEGPMEVKVAGARAWSYHGLPESGWSGIVQYRRQVLDRVASMPASSGYTVRFDFEFAEGFTPKALQLCIDTPEYWRVTLNASEVDFTDAESWVDPCTRRIEVAPLLKAGLNTLRLEQSPLDARAEVAPVWLTGDFSLTSKADGFVIEPPRSLELGSWSSQGWPFFDRACDYEVSIPEDGTLCVSPSSWVGSWLIAETDSARVQVDPDTTLRLPVRSGQTVRLRVVGLPHNLFGPFHVKPEIACRDGFSCAPFWIEPFADIQPREGKGYHVLDLGLLEAPQLQR